VNGHGCACAFVAAAALGFGPGPSAAMPRCEGRLPDTLVASMHAETLGLLRGQQYDALEARMNQRLAAFAAGRRTDEELQVDFDAFARPLPPLTPLISEWAARQPASYAAHHAMTVHLGALSERTGAASSEGLKAAAGWARKAMRLERHPLLSQAWLVANAPPGAPVRRWFDDALESSPDSVVMREAWLVQRSSRADMEAFTASPWVTALPPDRRTTLAYAARMAVAAELARHQDADGAIVQYQQAAALCRQAEPWVAIADLRLEQRRHLDALRAGEAAEAVSPGSAAGIRTRALALRGLGRHAEAVDLLASAAPSGDPDINYQLGCYLATGHGGTAVDRGEARRLLGVAARAGHGPAVDRLARLIAEDAAGGAVASAQGPLASPDRRRGSLAP